MSGAAARTGDLRKEKENNNRKIEGYALIKKDQRKIYLMQRTYSYYEIFIKNHTVYLVNML